MGDHSAIEWTDATWNPVRGCTRVSAGCGGPGSHGGCYAEAIAARFSGPGQPYEGLAEFVTRPDGTRVPRWTGKLTFGHNLDLPLRWRRPRRIFVNSMSDLFHKDVPDAEIDRVFAVMALCPQHTFQVLTKRGDRMWDYLTDTMTPDRVWKVASGLAIGRPFLGPWFFHGRTDKWPGPSPWPLRNIWLGVSAEDQATADERIPLLLQTPAAIRFVSAEPLLGPIDLTRIAYPTIKYRTGDHYLDALRAGYWSPKPGFRPSQPGEPQTFFTNHSDLGRLSWVIAGGESGPRARPAHPDWFRSLRDQCAAADVPFLFKQWGEWAPGSNWPDDVAIPSGHLCRFDDDRLSDDQAVWRVGKHAAGRRLDGHTHDEFPQVRP